MRNSHIDSFNLLWELERSCCNNLKLKASRRDFKVLHLVEKMYAKLQVICHFLLGFIFSETYICNKNSEGE